MEEDEQQQIVLMETKAEAEFILVDVQKAWRSAVRALNAAENAQMNDTVFDLQEIVAKLSQTYEGLQALVEAAEQ